MKVLGISGLHNSVSFRRRRFPALTAREYRIAQGLDAAAAVVIGSSVEAAAAEERFTGEKGTGSFPRHAINFCLRKSGLDVSDLDHVAHCFCYEPFRAEYMNDPLLSEQFHEVYSRDAQLAALERFLGPGDWSRKLVQIPHHMAHAASTYLLSGFDEALILVADGMGENVSTTVAMGDHGRIDILSQTSEVNSLGILYGLFTLYLGFEFNMDEYKVMGLAPYGDSRRFFAAVAQLIDVEEDGTVRIPVLSAKNRTIEDRATYRGTLKEIESLFGPARPSEAPIEQRHKDVAAAIQAVLQATLVEVLKIFRRKTGATNLCMAGGVALNCSANGVIHRSRLFKDLFVQPASADDGAALGAALETIRRAECPRFGRMVSPMLGPNFSRDAVEEALEGLRDVDIRRHQTLDDLVSDVASQIRDGKIIGWFQGRMEYGPRALGNRSILADPRDPAMRDRINALVKKREDFRPFAPAVTREAAARYFHIDSGEEAIFEHMLFVVLVRAAYRNVFPATTHCDGTARVQVVSRQSNDRFWRLLVEVERAIGHPVLLNTSFNVRGQPIVCTPLEAVATFTAANLDALVIDDYAVTSRH
jgi:carbamoyltransferase